ncbi:hypothetical protein LP419_31180 [Massilia sp. H-1]|nr:hypothetical protein LP419_31180 [Massilia sp. H-1]
MRGMFVMPGMIDSHVHYATNPNRVYAEAELKRNMFGGVTGVRDMAGDARSWPRCRARRCCRTFPRRTSITRRWWLSPSFFKDPRTVAAARGMQPGQVPWLYAVDDQTDIALAVAQARGTGASGMKIYANLPGNLVAKLVAEGKRQHFPVWSHLQVYPASPYDSLGATAVSHACMIARFARESGKAQYGHSGEPSYAGLTAADPAIMLLYRRAGAIGLAARCDAERLRADGNAALSDHARGRHHPRRAQGGREDHRRDRHGRAGPGSVSDRRP